MKDIQRRSLLFAGAGATILLAVDPALSSASPSSGSGLGRGVVVRWNQTLLRILRTPGNQPATVHASRSFAMLHLAVARAVAGGSWHGGSGLVAAASAAHAVLTSLYPARSDDLDAQLLDDLALVGDPAARVAGLERGRRAAARVLAARAGDGSGATPPAVPAGTRPGRYRPTPPNFPNPVFTHWAAVTPFLLPDVTRLRPARYPSLPSGAYAASTNEVSSLGQDTSSTRSADQTVQARFWSAPIWNYWNEIAQTLLQAQPVDLRTEARVFARLNLTIADAVIAFYDAKYHFFIWRPVTAVRLADTDANPGTAADPAWTPLVTTPADPAYPGAHSVVSQAAALSLAETFGDDVSFTVSSEVLAGVTRSFQRLTDAAQEAGLSRIYAGVHTRADHVAGRLQGAAVARQAST